MPALEPADPLSPIDTMSEPALIKKSPLGRNAFDLPEIRLHIAQYLAREDLFLCIQVCKQWHKDFIGNLWHTIDISLEGTFDKYLLLHNIPSFIKHGHHIRKLVTSKDKEELAILPFQHLNHLQALTLEMLDDPAALVTAYELLRRNMPRLTRLFFFWEWMSFDRECLKAEHRLVQGEIFSTGAHIDLLIMRGINMTRDDFSFMLRSMPRLTEIRLQAIYFTKDATREYFVHEGVTVYCGGMEQLWERGPDEDPEPMMVHFPNLNYATLWNYNAPSDFSLEVIEQGLSLYLKKLTKVDFDEYPADFVAELLDSCFLKGLESIEYLYNDGFRRILDALLKPRYRNMLKDLTLQNCDFSFEGDAHLEERQFVHDLIDVRLVSEILVQSFPKLTMLQIPMHQIEASQIEVFTPWACVDLEVLYVRFEGLKTRTMMIKVVEMLKQAKQLHRTMDRLTLRDMSDPLAFVSGESTLEEEQLVVVGKVVRHLLQFRRLRKVWLGFVVFHV